jgi:hypothetical protein
MRRGLESLANIFAESLRLVPKIRLAPFRARYHAAGLSQSIACSANDENSALEARVKPSLYPKFVSHPDSVSLSSLFTRTW